MTSLNSSARDRTLVAAIAVLSMAVLSPAAATAAKGEPKAKATLVPSCEEMPGRTFAQSPTWRVVLAFGTKAPRLHLLACKRLPGPAREVVRIQPSARYLTGAQLSGGIFALTEADQSGKYNPALSSTELFDLGGARTSRSPTFPFGSYGGEDQSVTARLLGGGALLTWKNAGPTTLLDAAGTTTVLPAAPLDAAVPPAPDGSGPGAATYVVPTTTAPTTTEPVRLDSAGPLKIDWVETRNVRRVANPLRVVRRAKERRVTLGVFYHSVVETVETRRAGKRHAKIELNGSLLGRIVPGTVAHAVAGSSFYAAVDAVWADTGRRSTRLLYAGYGILPAFAELPTPDGGWIPGQIAVSSGGALAVAEPGRLRVWDPAERVIDAPGLTALAIGLNSTYTQVANLFATDPRGVARTWKLPARVVTSPPKKR